MISDIVKTKNRLECTIDADACTVNAVRRAVLMDVGTWAADKVTFHVNTTCQPDEYIAHRIGMLPFSKIGDRLELDLNVESRDVTSDDIQGDFSVYPPCTIMQLTEG